MTRSERVVAEAELARRTAAAVKPASFLTTLFSSTTGCADLARSGGAYLPPGSKVPIPRHSTVLRPGPDIQLPYGK